MKLNEVSNSNSLHSVKDFIQSATIPYGLTKGQANGFIALMKAQGMYYLKSERDYIPYLRRYIGK